MSDLYEDQTKRIADALERIADILESNVHINIDHGHIEQMDHIHIDDIGEIHGDVTTHPKSY
mgnify:CR=1 FL=1|tara:strand:- start:133 stop:318 length:186 start_codon:yes stop_codon:yes gene_type:complete